MHARRTIRWLLPTFAISLCGASASTIAKADEVPLIIEVPKGADFSRVVLGAAGTLDVGSSGHVTGNTVLLTNSRAGATTLGAQSIIHANIYSEAQVTLKPRALVEGSVTTNPAPLFGPQANVTGPTVTNVALVPPTLVESTVHVAASTTDVTVPPAGMLALAAGAYRNVNVKPNGTLKVTAGTYTFEALDLAALGTLVVDTQQGPVLIYIRSALLLKGAHTLIGPAGQFLLAYLGTAPAKLERSFNATVLAPNATLRIDGAAEYRGVFWAKNLEVGAQAQVIHQAFDAWGAVFPPIPTLKCVTRFDATHYAALFGYVNPFDIDVRVPVGALNSISPPGDEREPIESFSPGVHASEFFVPFDGSPVTWNLGNRSATATSSSTPCTLADYPATEPSVDSWDRPGPAGISAAARYAPNHIGPGRSVGEIVTFSSGASSQGFQSLSTNNDFQLTIKGFNLPLADDGACGYVETYVEVSINGGAFERWDFPQCPPWPGACGFVFDTNDFVANVPPDQPTVDVVIRLKEDETLEACGGDDHILTATFTVDNTNGLVTGSWVNVDEPVGSGTLGPLCSAGNYCHVEHDNFYFDFTVHPSGKPRICTAWNAHYIDAGFGEDFLNSQGAQQVPASYAKAVLAIAHGGVSSEITTYLDIDGCIPRELTPDVEELVIASGAGSDGLTLSLTLNSRFCETLSGAECNDDVIAGARFFVGENQGPIVPTSDAALRPVMQPVKLCKAITQNMNYAHPECDIVTEQSNAFNAWIDGVPPSKIMLVEETEDDVTRVSAVVSHMLRREQETNGALGIHFGMIELPNEVPGQLEANRELEIATNAACDFGIGQGIGSCGSDPLRIMSVPACQVNEPTPECINADSRWKTVLAHEIGHGLQHRASGKWAGGYEFAGQPDHPGAPPLCKCSHINDTNTLHCLQSLEGPGAAQREAYAHFVAARTWNDLDDDDCTFVYYKAILGSQCIDGAEECTNDPMSALFINAPPVPKNCIEPDKWRNAYCLDTQTQSGEVVTDLSTEIDWMQFYFGVTHPNTSGNLSIYLLNRLYWEACGSGGYCQNKGPNVIQPGWHDIPGMSPPIRGIKEAMESLLADSITTIDQRNTLQELGDTFGVSESPAP